ncbi:MAG: response regulator [Gammaproteobacteria bacterium]|nr:response regulator [Gammaproteobacteria bacterium]
MPTESQDTLKSTLLFVDDEQNILSSLKRLFRATGHQILTAGSGREALALLEQQPVDLLISDMRMPEMDGAELLAQVAQRWPQTVRILLTGYADIGSTIRAVNEGSIYKYISKPWEDNDIRLTVQHALEAKHLQAERDRLLALTRQQNDQLKDLNANLEKKVEERTRELRAAHESLRKSYFSSIKTFSNLIGLREGTGAGHSKRVAEGAQKVALRLGLDKEQIQQIFFAALLHDIGKISLPDELARKPFAALGGAEKQAVARHPALGEVLLLGFGPLNEAARMIRSHHEYLDGSGYPAGISGEAIPLGARILAVVNDYDALQQGLLVPKRLLPAEAREYLIINKGRLYDPRVVDAFLDDNVVTEKRAVTIPPIRIGEAELRPGMVLARDLITKEGILVLAEGHILDRMLIDKIALFAKSSAEQLEIYVLMKQIKGVDG